MSARKQLYSVTTISIVDKLIKFGFLVVLSRLLTPADLGVVAAAMLVVGFAEMFSNVGLGGCLIQNKMISERDIRTATTLSVIVALALAALLVASKPFVVSGLAIAELDQAISWLALILVFRGFSTISSSLLQREMQVAKVMWIGVVAYFVGAALVSVPLALKGYGYMSVVMALVIENLLYMIGLYIAKRHSLIPLLDPQSSRHLLTKGMGFFATRTINYLGQNLDYIIVSRMLGPSALGFYSRAYKVMEYPSIIYRSAVDKVLFPLLSREQDNAKYLGRTMRVGLFTTTILSAAISAFVTANSREIVLLLLGPQWLDTATVLAILAAFTTFRLNYMICITYVRSRGLLRIATLHSLGFAVLMGSFAYIGADYGIKGVGIGAGIAVLIYCLSYNVHVCRLAQIPFMEMAKIYFTGLAVFLWVLLFATVARYVVPSAHLVVTLLIQSIVAAVACALLLHPYAKFLWAGAGESSRAHLLAAVAKILSVLTRLTGLPRICKLKLKNNLPR